MHRLLAALSLLVLLAGCGGDGSTDPTAGIAGTYSLRTVNGSPLPYTLQQSGTFKLEITSDAYALTDNGTWTEAWSERTTSNGQVTTETFTDAGTYSRSGTAITLVSPGAGAVSGTVSGGTLTLAAQGFSLVFIR